MFTGIIEELGTVDSICSRGAGSRLIVSCRRVASGLASGDSISVNGACLTALDVSQTSFAADLSPETLDRTTLGNLNPGAPVNLERAVTPATRLGGHLVQGHVDGRGTLISSHSEGEFWTVRIGFPPGLGRYFIEKGSVAVEGISLTIAALAQDSFDIALIPKTWTATNLSTLQSGDNVNLEVDQIAKYVERMIGAQASRLPTPR